MKRLVKVLSLLLALITCFTLVSCRKDEPNEPQPKTGHPKWNFYPEGYTCGFPNEYSPEQRIEIWWVETYEECLAAIELLKAKGSLFEEYDKYELFSYEGDLFDTKYCIRIRASGSDAIEFGDNPFDRKASCVWVEAYAFIDDVTIDELNYGDIKNYHVYRVAVGDLENVDKISSSLKYKWILGKEKGSNRCLVFLPNADKSCCTITRMSKEQVSGDHMSDECVEAILDSIRVINRNGEIK